MSGGLVVFACVLFYLFASLAIGVWVLCQIDDDSDDWPEPPRRPGAE